MRHLILLLATVCALVGAAEMAFPIHTDRMRLVSGMLLVIAAGGMLWYRILYDDERRIRDNASAELQKEISAVTTAVADATSVGKIEEARRSAAYVNGLTYSFLAINPPR